MNIRIEVPCTELTRAVLLAEYAHLKRDADTLYQKELNIDTSSFNHRQEIGKNEHRTFTIKIFLNDATSRKYKAKITEAVVAHAIERKAYELVKSRMAGAYETNGSVAQAIRVASESFGILETKFEMESLRKMFYRYRQARQMV